MKSAHLGSTLLALLTLGYTSSVESANAWNGEIVQYGTMREAIGQKQDQARVSLSELVKMPNYYAVGALEGLSGEVTIDNGRVTVTAVGPKGRLQPEESPEERHATLLAGAYVQAWTRLSVEQEVQPTDLDRFVAEKAAAAGIDAEQPFLFQVEGDFQDVRIHVINGACPIHARIKDAEIEPKNRPCERQMSQVAGKLVGVYAKDAVGDLTQPATSIHAHLLFRDPEFGQAVTAHVERAGLRKGAELRLPK